MFQLSKPIYNNNKPNDNINWHTLSRNPNAIHLLEQNLDKINWLSLSLNPNAIQILEQNLDKIVWRALSGNLNAIHLLENNLDKIDWIQLSRNPNAIHLLFNLDYKQMKENTTDFFENLIRYVFHPDRITRLANKVGIEEYDYLEIY